MCASPVRRRTPFRGAAALVHALDTVRGRSVARCYQKKLEELRLQIGSLSGLAEVVRQMKSQVPAQLYACVELRWLRKAEKQACEREPYKWLCVMEMVKQREKKKNGLEPEVIQVY